MERVDETKLNIGIITFHFPYNAGAALQSYALQTYLQRQHYNVKIINYRPWYHQNLYTPFRNPWQAAKEEYGRSNSVLRGIRYFLATIKSWTRYREVIDCNRKFQSFTRKNLNETSYYRTLRHIKKRPPECDIYLCGSDQIWNPVLTGGGYDYAYLLEFGKSTVRKLSYAVGLSGDILQDERAVKCLDEMEVLSVREAASFQYLKEKYGDKVVLDVDPTLLLERSDYESLMPGEALEHTSFIVTYVLPDQSGRDVLGEAEKLAGTTGIRIVNICCKPYEEMYDITKARCCGPEEFLWYIAHAEYVLTNSFHGTIFSLLFHKKFLAVPHTRTGNRIVDLLSRLGLQERIITEQTNVVEAIQKPVEYKTVDALIKEYSELSAGHLQKWIQVSHGR